MPENPNTISSLRNLLRNIQVVPDIKCRVNINKTEKTQVEVVINRVDNGLRITIRDYSGTSGGNTNDVWVELDKDITGLRYEQSAGDISFEQVWLEVSKEIESKTKIPSFTEKLHQQLELFFANYFPESSDLQRGSVREQFTHIKAKNVYNIEDIGKLVKSLSPRSLKSLDALCP